MIFFAILFSNIYCNTLEISGVYTVKREDYAQYANTTTKVIIGSGVRIIGLSAFNRWYYLAEIDLGESISEIDSSAFRYCWSLTKIVIPNSVRNIGSHAFRNCTSLKKVQIKGSWSKNIKSYCFCYCISLKSINLDDVVSIGSYSFCNCTSLPKISFGMYTRSISEGICFGCRNLKSVFGLSYSTIYESMFELCTSLVSIEINSVYTIEARAFARCTSLRCIYYEGESEPDINDEAFDVENNITVIVKETYENKKFGNLPIATYTEECGNINGKTSGNDDEKNSNTGEIVGGIVGSIGLVLLVGVLSCCHDHLCKCFRCCVECTCCDVGSSTSERGKMTPFEIEMFPLEKKIKSVLPPGIKAEQIPYQNPFGIGYETSIYQK